MGGGHGLRPYFLLSSSRCLVQTAICRRDKVEGFLNVSEGMACTKLALEIHLSVVTVVLALRMPLLETVLPRVWCILSQCDRLLQINTYSLLHLKSYTTTAPHTLVGLGVVALAAGTFRR